MDTAQLFDFIKQDVFGTELMDKAHHLDPNANGVQINGSKETVKVALGVSCNEEFLQKAVNWGAEVCLFHHGLPLSNKGIVNSLLPYSTQKQLKLIFNNELTVAGYHFCLDAHSEIGNNAQILKLLGLKKVDTYFDDWGLVGEFSKPKSIEEIARECSQLFRHDVFMILADQKEIKRVGVCSGGAIPTAGDVFDILDKKIDLHLTGVITEGISSIAKESGFSYFSCGHYATEVFGIKALGEKISKKFPKLEVEFIEVWNEL